MLRRFPIAVAVIALVTLAAAPNAYAGTGGMDRPFRATLVGEAYWEFPGEARPDCELITTLVNPTGQATHMGRIKAAQSHCPGLPEYLGDGRITIAAANGDEVHGTYDYDDSDVTNVIPMTITGGTGRFKGTSGSLTQAYNVEPQFSTVCTTEPFCFDVDPSDEGELFLDFTVSWPWSATLTGTISY